jgi:hypothetical protein
MPGLELRTAATLQKANRSDGKNYVQNSYPARQKITKNFD